jgi:hypothetical protein
LKLAPIKGATYQASDWSRGNIVGDVGSSFHVTSAILDISSAAGSLGTNLIIDGVPGGTGLGIVQLTGMTTNLSLTGTNNYIDVGNGGSLNLYQNVTANGQQNTVGGIALDPAHTGKLAVQVEKGGTLARGGPFTQGVTNQVVIQGTVYNLGGTVLVDQNNLLNITGVDGNGYSYWQKTDAAGKLQVNAAANINATGKYQIDICTVQLTGGGDRLDGAGLVFGNNNNTNLTIADSGPLTVTIQGAVTLGAKTTTKLNFNGTNNTADLLDVRGGVLTLNGTLSLNSLDGVKLTAARNFFDDAGTGANIAGAFAAPIMDQLNNRYTGTTVQNNNQLYYFQVGP